MIKNKTPWAAECQNYFIYETPYGGITIASDGSALLAVEFGEITGLGGKKQANAVTDLAAKQLGEYFAGKRRQFDVPVRPLGTVFQTGVWEALLTIPFGETRSYKQIALAVGSPVAYRAVGLANNRNPISIIIPCHRVIGSDGSLVGYGGGLDIKRKLLDLEKNNPL